MARRYVPKIAPHVRGPLDVAGLVLLCAGLLGVTDGLLGMRAVVGIVGALFLVAFYVWQRIAANPIVPPALLATPQLAKTYALEIVIGILEGSLFFIPTVLVATQGLSYVAAGLVAALGGFMFVAIIPASGRAIDRFGSRDVLLAGTILTEIGLAIFALGFQSLWLSLLSMVVAGCGFGALLGAPTRYIVTNETTTRTRATAAGLISQCLIVGQILGSSLAGLFIGASTSEFLGYRHADLAFCAAAFIALILTATLQSRAQERTRPHEDASAPVLATADAS